jgi:hypothetical protein
VQGNSVVAAQNPVVAHGSSGPNKGKRQREGFRVLTVVFN